jgi:DNA excision repair protein ERCC-2
VKLDPVAQRLEIGVSDLVVVAEPGPGFAGRGGGLGAWLGRSLHVAYQRSAGDDDPAFEAEVPLQESFDHRGWRVLLRGRADGVRPEAGGWRVEELKSLSARREGWLPAWRLQAALYARMLERTRCAPARAELVWIGGPAPLRERVALAPEDLERALARALDACLADFARREALRAAWRAAASAVRFPFPALRPGQAEILASVEGALARGEQLLIEAGTGSGKTAAILTPALRFAMETGRPLYVLTAATLQQHLAIDTLARLAPGGMPLVSRLRAKRRMCTRGDLLCDEAICDGAAGYAQKREAEHLVARCFDERGLALPDAVFALGTAAHACPYELQLDAAHTALVTVCDFNYAIDPGVMLPELRDPVRLRDAILVIDEIHQLPERARSALSVRIDGAAVRESAEAAALGGSALHRETREVCESLLAALDTTLADAGALPDGAWLPHEPPLEALEPIQRELQRLSLAALQTLEGAAPGPALAALLDLGFGLERFLRIAPGEPGFVSLVGRERGAPQLERFCRDPSRALGRLLGGCFAVVGASATLSPPEWFAAQLGLDPARSSFERVPHADASERRAVVIDASVTSAEKSRARETPRIARRLAALCEAVPGNCLALFPSHAFLEAVRAALPPLARRVRAQARGDGEPERSAHVGALRSRDDVLLLAVAGGALAEGVDYAGARLAAVAVVGPCLPAADAHRALLEEHYAEQFERGFELAYAVPGMIRVVQSAGRLLRTDADRGVIALLDRRFLREPYASLLPPDWLANRAPDALVGDPAEVAREFFRRE